MRTLLLKLTLAVCGLAPLAGAAQTAAAPAAQRSTWHGFSRIDFTWADRPCILVQPHQPAPNKPWIWRMESFEHEPQVDLALLARGWHLAHMDVGASYGSPKAMALFNQLYAHLIVHAGLSPRVVLEGFGRGGLGAINFAVAHPTRVAALYLAAPVLDLRSWPGRGRPKEWAECLEAYNLTEETVGKYRGPLERLTMLVSAKVPVLVVVGDADKTVPIAENTAILEKRYRELGGPIEVIVKPGADHQPHSLKDPARIVEFLVNRAKL